MTKNIFILFSILFASITCGLQAETKGKLEVAPAFLHIDILESGRTVKRMDLWAGRADFSYYLHKGLYIKPTVVYGHGGNAKGGIFTGSLGLGYCFPVCDNLLISPSVGGNYCHLWTRIDLNPFFTDIKETFKSWAPYVSFDVYYTFIPTWRVCAGIQYSWSKTKTTLAHIGKSHSKSQGFAYSLMLEHDLSDIWSINIGAAYNLSLTKEKHGLRGTGVKAGIVRWF